MKVGEFGKGNSKLILRPYSETKSNVRPRYAAPQTLLEAIRHFSGLDVATKYVAKLRWLDDPVCCACGVLDETTYTFRITASGVARPARSRSR